MITKVVGKYVLSAGATQLADGSWLAEGFAALREGEIGPEPGTKVECTGRTRDGAIKAAMDALASWASARSTSPKS